MESNIYGVFPQPVHITNLGNVLNKSEMNYLKNLETINSIGNTMSKEKYVLNQKPFVKLKNKFQICLQDYFDKIIQPKNDVQPYITQSWCAYTTQKEHHHSHTHPNSIVSGVFYVDVEDGKDAINFHRNMERYIDIEPIEYNHYNSTSWYFNVNKNDLLLFPSNLQHEVQYKQLDNRRISLAFNVFVKGTIGNYTSATELIL